MANWFLGEVDVAVGDKRWRLRLDFNTMIEFEDMTGKDAMSSFEAMERGEATLRDMRAMVHACMLQHHPDATARDAGELLSHDADALAALAKAAMPSAEEAKAATTPGDTPGNAAPGAAV